MSREHSLTEKETKRQIVTLFKEKERIEKEIEKLQNQLVQQLCPKEKQECEPAYCVFRMTGTCPFLREWQGILEEAQVPTETKYDLFLEFIQKTLEGKDVKGNN